MRIITPEQHAQIVEALESCTHSTNLSEGQEFDGDLVDEALATLQALPEVEVTAWMRKDTDVMHKTEKRSDYSYTHYYDKPLYATKEPS